ncbi:MAG: type II toxin-antitoxin system RelE/ParE family toxin [Tannerella sp.]|jgi:plasmid stabilization system protein ParE|nr:type II toxin-antitoxin system RelE/ParE family toxin [Tannerella sp.]
MKLNFSDLSRKRMDEIYRFYELKSSNAAVKMYNKILDEAETLKYFPYMAPIEPLLSDHAETYRSLPVRKLFKIVYYVGEDTIYISDIWDCRQSPDALKKRIQPV